MPDTLLLHASLIKADRFIYHTHRSVIELQLWQMGSFANKMDVWDLEECGAVKLTPVGALVQAAGNTGGGERLNNSSEDAWSAETAILGTLSHSTLNAL